jgi:hypothetical protein
VHVISARVKVRAVKMPAIPPPSTATFTARPLSTARFSEARCKGCRDTGRSFLMVRSKRNRCSSGSAIYKYNSFSSNGRDGRNPLYLCTHIPTSLSLATTAPTSGERRAFASPPAPITCRPFRFAIVHTREVGERVHLQPSGTRCPLSTARYVAMVKSFLSAGNDFAQISRGLAQIDEIGPVRRRT